LGSEEYPEGPRLGKAPSLARTRMDRVLEPEVMADPRQALAYARADFGEVNQRFVDELVSRHPMPARARVVDLGCGPADIPIRLAAAWPHALIVAVDASEAMLALGHEAMRSRRTRLSLICARLPRLPFADRAFDALISNSLLHHLPDSAVLWRDAARLVRPGGVVHVMDLFRPRTVDEARQIVERAAGDEDQILKDDFFNSLLAAFTPEEVRDQLAAHGLGHLACAIVSERHLLISGRR
jgi:ubiquinone/menaquinone biosynthesis C-methylase UbiE